VALGREKVDGIVQRGIDPLAGAQALLGGFHQGLGLLQGEQVLPHAACQGDAVQCHGVNLLSGSCSAFCLCYVAISAEIRRRCF